MQDHMIEQKVAKGMEAVGSGTAVSSGLAGWIVENHEFIWAAGVASGIITAIAGLIISYHFKSKADLRAEELHQAKMRDLS